MEGLFFSKVKITSHRKQKSKTPVLRGDSCKRKAVFEIDLTEAKNIFMVRRSEYSPRESQYEIILLDFKLYKMTAL